MARNPGTNEKLTDIAVVGDIIWIEDAPFSFEGKLACECHACAKASKRILKHSDFKLILTKNLIKHI